MPRITVPASEEVLWQLFRDGPTFDGDLVSKAARDHLERDHGLVAREAGWNWLTDRGARTAIGLGMGYRKDAQAQRQRSRGQASPFPA